MAKERDKPSEDWRDLTHLHAFLSLSLSDRTIERREIVWIKQFFSRPSQQPIRDHLQRIVEEGRPHQEELLQLMGRAADELSMGEKRRFVYNLAQLCKSKGSIGKAEYERVLDLAQSLGVPDTEADAIINSVYSVNDSFMAIIGLLALGVILYSTQIVIVPLVIALLLYFYPRARENLGAAKSRIMRD